MRIIPKSLHLVLTLHTKIEIRKYIVNVRLELTPIKCKDRIKVLLHLKQYIIYKKSLYQHVFQHRPEQQILTRFPTPQSVKGQDCTTTQDQSQMY